MATSGFTDVQGYTSVTMEEMQWHAAHTQMLPGDT
jgi:hypothetical protein